MVRVGCAVAALVGFMSLASDCHAARNALPVTCRQGERLATGSTARAALACHAKAVKRGAAVDEACVGAARSRLASAFEKAGAKSRRKGGCDEPGDAEATWRAIETLLADVRATLAVRNQSSCDAKRLAAIGAEAQRLLKAKAKTVVPLGTKPLAGVATQSTGRLTTALQKASKRDDCGGGDAASVAARVQQFAGVAGRLRGRVQAVKRTEFPAASHGDVVVARGDFEAMGFLVADDGAWIEGPLVPAAGWLVTFGTARARTDLLGRFSIEVPLGTPPVGGVYQPASDDVAIGPVNLAELAGDADTPSSVYFEVATRGACGMNEDPADEPPHCAEGAASSKAGALDRAVAAAINPDPEVYPPLEEGELGTYPDDDPAQVVCLDYDGYRPQPDRNPIGYPGSTCHIQVCLGCCDNERGDYRRFVGSELRRYIPGFDDPALPPALACVRNHGGRRYCQQIRQGDVAVKVRDTIVRASVPPPEESPGAALCIGAADPDGLGAGGPAGPAPFTVEPGEVVPIIVHNNGCHGRTHVLHESTEMGGLLAGAFLADDTIAHFAGSGPGYTPDRDLTYTAPAECPDDGASDVIAFETDGARATVEFRCGPDDGDEICFDFADGYQGWEGETTSSGGWGSVVHLDRNDGVIKLDGVDDDDGQSEPNAWVYRSVRLLPDATTLTLDVSAHDRDGADALYRVRLVDEAGTPHVLIDWTQKSGIEGSLTFSTVSADVSAFAGQDVTLYLEQDGNAPGAHEQIYYDNVCLDAATDTSSTTSSTAPTTSSTTTIPSTSTTSTSVTVTTTSTTTSVSATTTPTSSTTTTTLASAAIFYRLYAANGVDGPVATLTDPIRSEMVDVGGVMRFLVPASVLGSGVFDADAYQTCHDHPGAPLAASADVFNHFGPQTLAVGDPDTVCVRESATLLAIDPFNCYAASGTSIGLEVPVSDAFNTESVTVGAPVLYCVPVAIGSPVVAPAAHLVCYDTTTSGTAPGDVQVANEFGASTVGVGLPVGVCMPSTTTSFVP